MISGTSRSDDARRNLPCPKSTPGIAFPSGPWQGAQLATKRRLPSSDSRPVPVWICPATRSEFPARVKIKTLRIHILVQLLRRLSQRDSSPLPGTIGLLSSATTTIAICSRVRLQRLKTNAGSAMSLGNTCHDTAEFRSDARPVIGFRRSACPS